jgi:hypothetical protein
MCARCGTRKNLSPPPQDGRILLAMTQARSHRREERPGRPSALAAAADSSPASASIPLASATTAPITTTIFFARDGRRFRRRRFSSHEADADSDDDDFEIPKSGWGLQQLADRPSCLQFNPSRLLGGYTNKRSKTERKPVEICSKPDRLRSSLANHV